MMNRFLAPALWLFLTSNAWAHPGHGGVSDRSPLHFVLEPQHGIFLLLAVAMTYLVTRVVCVMSLAKRPELHG